MSRFSFIFELLALAAVMAASAGCAKGDEAESQPCVESISIRTSSSDSNGGQSFVSVTAVGKWAISFSEDVSWARLNTVEGSGNKADIIFEWDENPVEKDRELTIVLSSKEVSQSVATSFLQKGVPTQEIVPDPVAKWMEIPSTDNKKLYFFTHPMTIDGKKYRNYSYYWDVENLVAHWVAYPLNSTLIKGSSGRSEKWGLDPKLPRQYQPVLYSAYKVMGVRGHQLPSADRQQYEYNVQTFYGVNITPQNYELNGGAWANLEGYVRTRSRMVDTLYIVTGCTIEGSTDYAYDNDGKAVRVPTGYFKALLAYSAKKTVGSRTGGYAGAGFYYKNEPYKGSFLDEMMTIDDLEELTGFDFFINLPDALGQDAAAAVESTLDKWWNQ